MLQKINREDSGLFVLSLSWEWLKYKINIYIYNGKVECFKAIATTTTLLIGQGLNVGGGGGMK